LGKALDHQDLFSRRQGHAFGPPRRHVGEHQAVHERSFGHTATMLDKVDFEEARLDVFPVGEGSNRNASPQRGVDPATTPALANRFTASRLEQPVDGRSTDRQQALAKVRIQRKMPMTLHGHNHQR